ncbi:MAG TPA: MarR family transcriptional regulator [Burkholderiales bacterium]|jgi:DNA-binding MarR family transcriptional regulator|nr:MarR family transcriptional regulator [Burkholderiales bacterium]
MPPATDPRQRAWARFVVAQALLVERIEAAFAQAGLPSLDWYDVLWVLERSEHGRLRMADLAEQAVVSRSNVTRLADRLEKAGLVQRMSCPMDGRSTFCVLTDKGRALRARMWTVYRRQIDSLFGAHLSVREADEMTKVFERIISSAKERTQS